MTARFRVVATCESRFVVDVEADSAAAAALQVGALIRGGGVRPILGPAISDVQVIAYRDPRDAVNREVVQ